MGLVRVQQIPLPAAAQISMQAISILQSVTERDIRLDPFPHLRIDQALPGGYYQELSDSFPDPAAIAQRDGLRGGNQLYNASACSYLDSPQYPIIWKEFAAYHCSQQFFRDMLEVWAKVIRTAYPQLETQRARDLADFSVAVRQPGRELTAANRQTDMVMDCQIAVNTPPSEVGTVRGPHVDHPYKIYTANLYFRSQEDDSSGGDLELMRYMDPKLRLDVNQCVDRRFVRRTGCVELGDLPPAVAEPVSRIPYGPNTLVMWINSPHTVHQVTPRSVTRHYRRYVNLIAESFHPGFDGFFESHDSRAEFRQRLRARLNRLLHR